MGVDYKATDPAIGWPVAIIKMGGAESAGA
jgi:hypothetical protein